MERLMSTLNTTPSWIPLADEALKRAAERARDFAIQTNTGICVMQDAKIVRFTASVLNGLGKWPFQNVPSNSDP